MFPHNNYKGKNIRRLKLAGYPQVCILEIPLKTQGRERLNRRVSLIQQHAKKTAPTVRNRYGWRRFYFTPV